MLYKFSKTMALIFLVIGIINQKASATSYYSIAQSSGTIKIAKTSSSDTTTLIILNVRCAPSSGEIADVLASTQIKLIPKAGESLVQAGISITRDNIPPYEADTNHISRIVLNVTNGTNITIPVSMQRFDSCTPNEKITYRLVAWRENAEASSSALQPRMRGSADH